MGNKHKVKCEKCPETKTIIKWWDTPYGKFRLCEKCAEIPLEKLLNLNKQNETHKG